MHLFPPALREWPDGFASLPSPGWLVVNFRFGYESFFVLGGFFVAHSYRTAPVYLSVPSFLLRRVLRLAIPYWITILAGAAVVALSWGLYGREQPETIPFFLATFFFVEDFAGYPRTFVLWFIAPLMQFLILWSAAFWLVRKAVTRRRGSVDHDAVARTLWGLAAFVFVVSCAAVASEVDARWYLLVEAHYLVLGCVTYWAAAGAIDRRWLVAAVAVEAALALWLSSPVPAKASIMTAVLFLTSGRSFDVPRAFAPLVVLGRWSYSIYLMQFLIVDRTSKFVTNALSSASPTVAAALAMLVSVAATVAAGAIFYFLVERTVRRWVDRIPYRA